MTKDELKQLVENLKKRTKEIDAELRKIASENPLIKGDFDVTVDDLGPSQEDAAQEASELDRQQALVNTLEKERKEIAATIDKIESGQYGKCQNCSASINLARLKAVPTASLCIACASNIPRRGE